ncbi:RNA-binding domain-containing protein [Marinospirillum sp.]|uniref:RNA-binding domain-containing protein n=1 Tax=Marinospirillum sp. TaxID=2183934 RepID=UPI00384BEB2F
MSVTPHNPLELIQALEWVESNDLELKSARGGLPKSLWETYSAMANTDGGIILLGVEDNGKITGLTDATKLKKSFWDTVNNKSKISINLLTDQDVHLLDRPEGQLLAIRIPRATRHQRPVFLGNNPLSGTYRRNYEGDYKSTEQEVGRLLADRSEEPADSRLLNNFTLDDLDTTSLQQFRQRFASHKPTHPWLSENDEGLLKKLGGWRLDRQTGQQGLTLAGLLMFGRDEALREALPGYHLDYREILTDDPDERWSDRLHPDGTWHANLFQFYLKVVLRLTEDLKLPFALDKDLFRKGEGPVHEGIREALVNALIHADYQGIGGILVEKHRDRFIFTNPGTLLISLDQLLQGNISECRNKSLQTMFLMLGAAEKAGSGVDKIRSGWESQHWRQPLVKELTQPDRVRWVLPMLSLIPDSSLERLQKLFGNTFKACSKLEVQALVTADLEGSVDNLRLQQITHCHARDVTGLLQTLVARGMLEQEGRGRWTRYQLPDHPASSSVLNSTHKSTDSVHSSAHNANFQELEKLAQPARNNKRLPPEDMQEILVELCRGRWLTRNELAHLVQRNPDSLRYRFLSPMVAQGRLALRYPDKPNRSDQAYTA